MVQRSVGSDYVDYDTEDEEQEGMDEHENDADADADEDEDEDDDEDEDEECSDEDNQTKKKKMKREYENNEDLDEDDYELIRESTCSNSKRLKKAGGTTNSDDNEMNDLIVYDDEDRVGDFDWTKWGIDEDKEAASALQDAAEIFCNPSEFLILRKEKRSDEEDEIDPFVVSEKNKEYAIRETDVPERIQLSEEITGPPPTDNESIEQESLWIHAQLIVREKGVDKDDIGRVLRMVHLEKLDIPFIAMYRREQCLSLLKDEEDSSEEETGERKPRMRWHKLLWDVCNLDKKWLLLQKRKRGLQMYYSKRYDDETPKVVNNSARLDMKHQVFDSICEVLRKAGSDSEIDDVDAKFRLHFPCDEVEGGEVQFKGAEWKSLYSICDKAGLWEVASKFVCSTEQFGSCCIKERINSEPGDGNEIPEEVAKQFECEMFNTPEDVIKGARHMAAVEIGCEPIVKKYVRSIFMVKAVVSTSPTIEGISVMDSYHELAGVKWLRNKPVSEFVDAQWLRIQNGEEEKLLQVAIRLPENIQNEIFDDFKENYLSECVNKSAQLWNKQREKILEDAFSNFILPSLEKEARALLTARSKTWLRMEYGRHLWSKVSTAPYQKTDAKYVPEDESELRVMACCWGPGNPATTFVMLDSTGELVDVLHASSVSLRSKALAAKKHKEIDRQRLLDFLMRHQPHVICLGAANLSCKNLKDDIYEIIYRMVEGPLRRDGKEYTFSCIVYGDESLPCIYENSRLALYQIPDQPGIVRRAVGLGHYLLNPLAMIAALCGPRKEILAWKLCPLEHFLTPDEKFEMVEQVMIDATNQVGLDINLAARHEWQFAPLQFISGLGPCKASALQRELVRAGSIFSRKQIPIRGKVFLNAVGFLRVCRSGAAAASSRTMDLLDDTRIYPESYGLAEDLAMDVYAEDLPYTVDKMDDDGDREMAIEHVQERPEMLKSLEINEYSFTYFREFGNRKSETFYLIKMELLHGFGDWRNPYREPGVKEQFYMLSGETEDSFPEGKIVHVTVRYVAANRVWCTFDSGMRGLIRALDFSDDGYDPEKVHEGEVLTCRIKGVDETRFHVYLTCKENELLRKPQFVCDPYYQESEIGPLSEQEKVQKEKVLSKKHFKPRMIVHPCFQNLTADGAICYLSDKDVGECIIRPSSRGFLALTQKIYDGLYTHKEIVDGGKDSKDITSSFHLGKTLTIGKEAFEDLDEIMSRYVNPLASHLKNMLSYRKFRRGTKTEVDGCLLKSEKAKNPARVAYCFGISHVHPGTFILSYIRNSNPHHEYIGLEPKGFRFRKKNFKDIKHLVAYFQKIFDKPPPGSGQPIQTVAAMVPVKGQETWGSYDEGWNVGRAGDFVRGGAADNKWSW